MNGVEMPKNIERNWTDKIGDEIVTGIKNKEGTETQARIRVRINSGKCTNNAELVIWNIWKCNNIFSWDSGPGKVGFREYCRIQDMEIKVHAREPIVLQQVTNVKLDDTISIKCNFHLQNKWRFGESNYWNRWKDGQDEGRTDPEHFLREIHSLHFETPDGVE